MTSLSYAYHATNLPSFPPHFSTSPPKVTFRYTPSCHPSSRRAYITRFHTKRTETVFELSKKKKNIDFAAAIFSLLSSSSKHTTVPFVCGGCYSVSFALSLFLLFLQILFLKELHPRDTYIHAQTQTQHPRRISIKRPPPPLTRRTTQPVNPTLYGAAVQTHFLTTPHTNTHTHTRPVVQLR